MDDVNVYLLISSISSLIILAYLYTLLSKRTRIPEVLFLIFTGIALKEFLTSINQYIAIPDVGVEIIGIIGLIMIVLEAGLDLKYSRAKLNLIKNALFSSAFILALSVAMIGAVLRWQLHQPWLNSIVYAIPLSVMSSAIIISSTKILTEDKREFLAYESAFSDILGILVFDYFIATSVFSLQSVATVGIGIVIAIILSVAFSLLLVWVLSRSNVHVKFYLMFATLLLLYSVGRLGHLPALLIMLIFGLLINNWGKIRNAVIKNNVPSDEVAETRNLLKSITLETSFLIRTMFFVLFGYSIELTGLLTKEVLIIGTIIVLVLYLVRYIYLRMFVEKHVVPEIYYAPRGLVTILLFYRIPEELKLGSFNDGIIFYVIIATGVVMALGSMFFTPKEATNLKLR